jgi:hypothetical protein
MGKKTNPYALKRSYLEVIKQEQNKKLIADVQKSVKQFKMYEFQNFLSYLLDNPEALQIDWEIVEEEKRNAFTDIEKFIKIKAEEFYEDDEEDDEEDDDYDNKWDSYWDESASYCTQPD